jgi:RNA polymerase sigma-70 factor (ECF subfamily)
MNNFLANEWRRSQRVKRGGAIALFSLDEQDAEQRFVAEPLDDATPERLFLRRWVDTVLDQVMDRLREELTANGYAGRFEILRDFLVRDSGVSYEEVAEQLGLSLNAAGSVIHRLRSRFRQLFRHEIAQTVASPDEVDDEIRCLLGAL